MDALAESGMRELDQLYGGTVESAHTEMFSVRPRRSYVPKEWIKAAPEFWKPKPAMAPAAKPAEAKKTTP